MKENDDIIVYIYLSEFNKYEENITLFIKDIIDCILSGKKEKITVNFNWSNIDMLMEFFITTTKTYLINNNLIELLKYIEKDKSDIKNIYPEYNPDIIGTSNNGKYIEPEDIKL